MNSDTKQKVMISLIFVVLLILGWQVLLLVRSNSNDNSQNASAPSLAASSNAPTAIAKTQPFPAATAVVNKVDNQIANSLSTSGNSAATNTPGNSQALNSVQTSNVSGSNVDPAVAANQQQYLQLVTEYQMVQIQRMIAEDEEAIAIAKSNAAKAVASTVQLAGGSPSTVTSVIPAAGNSDEYELIFTGQQGDQWTATVKKDGQLYDVNVGTKLPDDSQVMAIDDNGVLIAQGESKKLITFSGVSIIGAQPGNPQSNLSGVSTNISQNNSANNAQPSANNASQFNQAGMVHNNGANNNLPNNGTNSTTQNSGSSTKTSAVSNSTPVNSTQAPQQPANTSENNSSAFNKSKSTIAVVSNAGVNNKTISKTNSINAPVIKTITSVSTANPINTAVIKKLPVNNVANAATAVPAPSASAANHPVNFPPNNKVSSTVATSGVPVASYTPEIKPAAAIPVSQAKSFIPQNEAMPAQIAKANAQNYTIQLIADNHLAPLNNYVRENHLKNQAITLLTHRWGQDWYILVYGQYKTAAQANAAIKQLPKVALQWGPFARRIGDVQNMVNSAMSDHGIEGINSVNSTT